MACQRFHWHWGFQVVPINAGDLGPSCVKSINIKISCTYHNIWCFIQWMHEISLHHIISYSSFPTVWPHAWARAPGGRASEGAMFTIFWLELLARGPGFGPGWKEPFRSSEVPLPIGTSRHRSTVHHCSMGVQLPIGGLTSCAGQS